MNWFWSILLKGLATVLPIFITIYSIYWLGISSEEFLGNTIKYFISDEYYWPGMGVVIAVAMVMLVGVLVNNRVGEFFLRQLHHMITHIPVANTIYNAVQDMLQFLASSRDKSGMDQVVEINLGNDMRLLGFVTQQQLAVPIEDDGELVGVYLPMSYMIGGFTIYLPRKQIKAVDISVEKAMRLTLTAGVTGQGK